MSSALEPAGAPGQFRLTGPAGFRHAARLLEAGNRLFDAAPTISVDLSGVTDVDSATLALLLEWQRLGNRRGRPVAFTGMPSRLAALAKLSGVAQLLASASDGQGAASAPASPAASGSPS